jgi:hypothetical protein
MTVYKCLDCFLGYIQEAFISDGKCPICNSKNIAEHCELDRPCRCGKDIHETVKLCEKCGEPVCPVCNCHDVAAISRITGYMSEIGGWSFAKRQEFKDRKRYNIGEGSPEVIQ